jgi:transposase
MACVGHRGPNWKIEQGAQLFVAALGASSYIYAEADLDAGARRLDRLAHTRFRFAGQVPYDTKACPGHRGARTPTS